jgi:hypothetical protein
LSKRFVSLQITLAVPSVKTTNKSSFQNIKSCALVKLTPLCEQKIGNECFAISNYKENISRFMESKKYNVEYLTVNKEKSQINLDFKNVVVPEALQRRSARQT